MIIHRISLLFYLNKIDTNKKFRCPIFHKRNKNKLNSVLNILLYFIFEPLLKNDETFNFLITEPKIDDKNFVTFFLKDFNNYFNKKNNLKLFIEDKKKFKNNIYNIDEYKQKILFNNFISENKIKINDIKINDYINKNKNLYFDMRYVMGINSNISLNIDQDFINLDNLVFFL